jgi:hypothetical protein
VLHLANYNFELDIIVDYQYHSSNNYQCDSSYNHVYTSDHNDCTFNDIEFVNVVNVFVYDDNGSVNYHDRSFDDHYRPSIGNDNCELDND